MTVPLRSLLVLLCLLPASPVRGDEGAKSTDSSRIRVGHWLEVRGVLVEAGKFAAEEAEVRQPEKYRVLIGSARNVKEEGFEVLGRRVSVPEGARWRGLALSSVEGKRVKVEGRRGRSGQFEAAKISSRGEGRERISGPVQRVRRVESDVIVWIMDYRVTLPASVGHAEPFERIALTRSGGGFETTSEDDQFGEGIRVTEALVFSGLLEGRSTYEGEFDLNRNDDEDRLDLQGSLRLRLEWRATGRVASVFEFRQSAIYRDDAEDGSMKRDDGRFGETFVYVRDALAKGWNFQVGRQDFDEPREWIYDQNLDGVRLIADRPRWRLELSGSTTLYDGSPRDQEATNLIGYLSNNDRRRHVALYAVHRDFDTLIEEASSHVGVRALGRWLPENRSWLELAAFRGTLGETNREGWAVDLGTTWTPVNVFSITVGYALGSGGSSSSTTDRTFRQTGFQDNNARFGGVTSFRYYGELVDPELANLQILTAGVGFRVARRTSIDLVAHHYSQDQARDRLVDADLDRRPDGINTELGWELDLILGSRTWPSWDFEVVGAYFEPGTAFEDGDSAYLGKLQVRYRF
jgi:alginate production protein